MTYLLALRSGSAGVQRQRLNRNCLIPITLSAQKPHLRSHARPRYSQVHLIALVVNSVKWVSKGHPSDNPRDAICDYLLIGISLQHCKDRYGPVGIRTKNDGSTIIKSF